MKIFKGQGTADLGKPWRFEEDGLTVTRGCAWSPPGCHPTGCGIKTYVNSNGELVRVEGDENHPITNGRLCVRCLTIRDYVYNPDRVLYPDEARPRGPRQEQVGAHHLGRGISTPSPRRSTYYKDKYGAESILVMGGTGREGGPMLPAYAQACTRHAQRLLHAVRLLVLHPARCGHDLRHGRHVPRDGLRRWPARTLRRPDVHASRAHRVLGQGSAAVQR